MIRCIVKFCICITFQAIACAVQFDDQHVGIYAGDGDCYVDFAEVFDPIIQEYHGVSNNFNHKSDLDATKITGNVNPNAPVHSTRLFLFSQWNSLLSHFFFSLHWIFFILPLFNFIRQRHLLEEAGIILKNGCSEIFWKLWSQYSWWNWWADNLNFWWR